MRLIDLQIEGFGKLNNRRIEFSEGTNLISGHNEAGKSTVYACIRAMFFGMVRAKGVAALTDTYSHYKPWFAKSYGAELRVEDNGHIYSIKRDFLKDPVGCSVYDETAMEAVPYADRFVAELILNMSEETYDNTISISKLRADADGNLSGALKKYIVNMDTTGSHALNCTRARAYLNEEKRKLAEGISPDAAKEYAVNCSEIKRLEKCIRENDAVTRVIPVATDVAGVVTVATFATNTAVKEDTADKASPENNNEEIKAAISEQKALESEMQCLDAEIIGARQKLRSHSVYSSKQVKDALKEFHDNLDKYQQGAKEKTIGTFRALYIVFFLLTVMDIFAAAYICGSSYNKTVLLASTGIGIAFLVLGIVFLILCIASKKKFKNKSEEFGKYLERYTGYREVSEARIERVRSKLEELLAAVTDVEAKEIRLAQLSEKAKEIIPAQLSEAAKEEVPVMAEKETAAMAIAAAEIGSGDAHPSNGIAVNDAINEINAIRAANVALKELLRKNDAINEEIDAIDLALEKIDEISDTMKDSLGVHLNANASEYIKAITDGAYDSLSVDDELNVFMNTKDKMVPIEQVSNGTADQIYMALRLAGVRLIQNGEDKLPLIFDDSFVNYDDDRLAATLSWLVKAYGGQIIIFSCQKREEQLLTENDLTFNPIHL